MRVVIDTSALCAVLLGEDDAEFYLDALARHAGDLAISTATVVETSIVLERKAGPEAVADMRQLLERLGAQVPAFTEAHATAAFRAWRRFGKGHHDAALNLGDCYSYGLAKATGSALLFKGQDFAKTDIAAA